MTVAELIAELQELPQDLIVIVQKDSEGNGYSPLAGSDHECVYVPDSTWSGEVYSNEDYADKGYAYSDAVPCVVLFPVN